MLPVEFNRILPGDTLKVLRTLPNECIDCIVTSPPYYALRDYGVDGQIGLEQSLEDYLERMLAVTAELKRVLKTTGTLWWNHGDSYGGSGMGTSKKNEPTGKQIYQLPFGKDVSSRLRGGKFEKCLLMQPYRLAQKMIDEQGWILRNILIWHKPNAMPSSVKDRFTVDYEPVFFFTKSKKYWFEQQLEKSICFDKDKRALTGGVSTGKSATAQGKQYAISKSGCFRKDGNRAMRSVWKIPTRGFSGMHFATFPERLIEIPILAGCPETICKKCGEGREEILKLDYIPYKNSKSQTKTSRSENGNLKKGATRPQQMKFGRAKKITTVTGHTDCGCNAGWKSGIVLDPFMGAGTTAVVAQKLGRRWLGIELNPEYIKIAEQRISALSDDLEEAV